VTIITNSWRDVLPVHPAAELFPMMSDAELRELGEDIKKNGLKVPVILWSPNNGRDHYLLDGRNRLDAMELVGLPTVYPNGVFRGFSGDLNTQSVTKDPYVYVISTNIHRRQLTADQRRELIAKVLKAKPEQSNRQIAKQVKADHKTVAAARAKAEATGEIPQLKKTVGKDGKERPACKPKAEQKVLDSPQEAHAKANTTPKTKLSKQDFETLEKSWRELHTSLEQSWRDVRAQISDGNNSRLRDAVLLHKTKCEILYEALTKKKTNAPLLKFLEAGAS
jgi:hypothetical protein